MRSGAAAAVAKTESCLSSCVEWQPGHSGTVSERTFVWPSRELVTRVTNLALAQLGVEAESALDELLAPPR